MNANTMQHIRSQWNEIKSALPDSAMYNLAAYNKSTNVWEFIFKTKDEYMAWRTQWRAVYRELSEAIREHRQLSRRLTSDMAKRHNRLAAQENPDLKKDDAYLVDLDQKATKALERLKKATLRGRFYLASELATTLLDIRQASKIEAERQYRAQKEVVIV